MKILISNDDGVFAPGINALAAALKQIADVTVIAPDRDRSAASNSLTLSRPIRIKEVENGSTAVEGTPTDSVHLALTGLMPEKPDIVVSGINDGANLGDDVLYSGTVAAAMEGRFLGLPAIAISLAGKNGCRHFATAAEVAKNIVTRLRNEPLSHKTILNVNVPDVPISELRGIEVTRLGARHCAEPTLCEKDPRGKPIYWVGPPGQEQDAGEGTDFFAIKNRRVSITPLQFDLTHHECRSHVAGWVDGINFETY